MGEKDFEKIGEKILELSEKKLGDFRNYDPHTRDELKHLRQAKEILPKGSIIVFPSFVWHRVKPVKKGTRYSLVTWNLGYPFK